MLSRFSCPLSVMPVITAATTRTQTWPCHGKLREASHAAGAHGASRAMHYPAAAHMFSNSSNTNAQGRGHRPPQPLQQRYAATIRCQLEHRYSNRAGHKTLVTRANESTSSVAKIRPYTSPAPTHAQRHVAQRARAKDDKGAHVDLDELRNDAARPVDETRLEGLRRGGLSGPLHPHDRRHRHDRRVLQQHHLRPHFDLYALLCQQILEELLRDLQAHEC